MKSLERTIKDVERDLVINMVLGIRHGRINLKEARSLSKSFMTSFPFQDYKSLFETLYMLSNKYKEVRKVYIKYFPEFENEQREIILTNMRKFMKINDFENAIKVARGENYG